MIRPWKLAILLYLLIAVTLLISKPSMFFGDNMKVKDWGVQTSSSNSIFSIKVVLPLLGIVCYYIASVVLLVMM